MAQLCCVDIPYRMYELWYNSVTIACGNLTITSGKPLENDLWETLASTEKPYNSCVLKGKAGGFRMARCFHADTG